MTKLNLNFYDASLEYPSDCERICRVALTHQHIITPKQSEEIWKELSNMMAAGWLCLPDDDEDLFIDIQNRLEGSLERD